MREFAVGDGFFCRLRWKSFLKLLTAPQSYETLTLAAVQWNSMTMGKKLSQMVKLTKNLIWPLNSNNSVSTHMKVITNIDNVTHSCLNSTVKFLINDEILRYASQKTINDPIRCARVFSQRNRYLASGFTRRSVCIRHTLTSIKCQTYERHSVVMFG